MTSPPSSNFFSLYDLNKVCFLAVAEHLDNRGRRKLSQTCQRFRSLLIPPQRFDAKPTAYWDEISFDEDRDMKKHKRKPKRKNTETRCPLKTMRISQTGLDRFSIKIGNNTKEVEKNYPFIMIYGLASFEEPRGLYRNDGKIRTTIVGRLPGSIHETVHEIKKFYVFDEFVITIKTPKFIRLPTLIYHKHEFYDIPVCINGKLIAEDMTEEAVRILTTDFKEKMPPRSDLTLCLRSFYVKDQVHATTLATLQALKRFWLETSTTVEWEPGPSTADDSFRDPITIRKSKENSLVVRYNGNYDKQF